jgi:transposase-like protein
VAKTSGFSRLKLVYTLVFYKMSKKRCSKCNSYTVKKDGKMRWKQRYKCTFCGYVFQNSSQTVSSAELWEEYTKWKQTYQQLSEKYWISITTIKKKLDSFEIKKKN